jgi:hypothetical protein
MVGDRTPEAEPEDRIWYQTCAAIVQQRLMSEEENFKALSCQHKDSRVRIILLK